MIRQLDSSDLSESSDPDYEVSSDGTETETDTDSSHESPKKKKITKTSSEKQTIKRKQTSELSGTITETETGLSHEPPKKTKKIYKKLPKKKDKEQKSRSEGTNKEKQKKKIPQQPKYLKEKRKLKESDSCKRKEKEKRKKEEKQQMTSLKRVKRTSATEPVSVKRLKLKKHTKTKESKHRPRTKQRVTLPDSSKRTRYSCPICPLTVIHLPRHLRQAHDYSDEKAISYTKQNKYKLTNKQPKQPVRQCPIQNCPSAVQNLGQHLCSVHGIGYSQRKELIKLDIIESDECEGDMEVDIPLLPKRINAPSIHEKLLTTNVPFGFGLLHNLTISAENMPQSTTSVQTDSTCQSSATQLNQQSTTSIPTESTVQMSATQLNPQPTTSVPTDSTGQSSATQFNPQSTTSIPTESTVQSSATQLNPPSTTSVPTDCTIKRSATQLDPQSTTSIPTDNTIQRSATQLDPQSTTSVLTDSAIQSSSTQLDPKYVYYNQHPEIKKFFKYLISADRGKDASRADQTCKKVFSIWSTIDPNMFLHSIFEGDLIRDVWLKNFDKQPGTKKSYLCALREYYNFVRYDDREGKEKVGKLLFQTSRWMTTINASLQIRNTELQVRESETMLEPQDIQLFLNSDFVYKVKSYFDKAVSGDELSQKEHCQVRNYLMLMILIHNAQRAGAIVNFTLRALKHHREVKGGAIVHIVHHKTAKQGPVTLFFNQELFKQLQIYVNKVRPYVPNFNATCNEENTPVFLTYNIRNNTPTPVNTSTLNSGIQGIWCALKLETQKAISATKIRKATTTAVRSADPEIRENLAMHMTHRSSTADRYYFLQNRRENAIHVCEVIRQVMTEVSNRNAENATDTTNLHSPSEMSNEPNNSKIDGESDVSADLDPVETPIKTLMQPIVTLTCDQSVLSTVGSIDTPDDVHYDAILAQEIPQSSRRAFSRDDSIRIVRLCTELINSEEYTTTKVSVLDTLSKTEEGRKIVKKYQNIYGASAVKKLVDRVRSEKKKKRKTKEIDDEK